MTIRQTSVYHKERTMYTPSLYPRKFKDIRVGRLFKHKGVEYLKKTSTLALYLSYGGLFAFQAMNIVN